ncbi:MAG: glycosyltransferase [Bacteroidales bacterium]|nr:glycosyltransferase [Clostridium sp.]MCM1204359.1 glycosyltransferase [Bacteroidales bacterium]
MNDILVSVIMPVYNGERYLNEAVESILGQTYKDIEFIIVDDGSTDNTLNILLNYKKADDRIIIITRENRGLVKSLNEAILVSKGKYIARMDADDISHVERIEKQVLYMERNSDVYLLGTNYSLIYEEGVREEIKKAAQGTHRRSQAPIEKKDWFFSTNETMKFIHPTIMVRRELFDKIGLYRQYQLEDLELYFRAGVYGLRIDKLEEVLLDYRVRAASKSRTDMRAEQTRELMEVKMKYLVENIMDSQKKWKYLIWGADISGIEGIEVIQNQLPDSVCLGYIDTFKEGKVNGYPIIKPDKIEEYNPDYVFICTNGGAVPARKALKELGFNEVERFFKIS